MTKKTGSARPIATTTTIDRRPAAVQPAAGFGDIDSAACAASLRDTNSVKSRTRSVLRVSPCVRSQSVPYKVFDPAIKGETDRFAYRFVKP
ncbi:hypothetical protein [Sphingomonas sp. MMS24-J13]|uniref:hypothetical protein n=1 Tax=Sphingomonas sp. MMS24-J13 TaxID=3238686 RepID=UPI00384EC603